MSTNSSEYRDSIATVDNSGKRVWVFPKKPKGKYYNRRKIVGYSLLLFLFAAPFITVNGEPFLLFNIIERKFIIFGHIFWPQDLHLFAITMITLVVFVIVFTIVFGRLFCGWVCPQTIFMEMVFRRIEYWIEGDYTQQKKLKKSPWNTEKIFKKLSKHGLFIFVSFLVSHTFLSYIIGYKSLFAIVTDSPLNHLTGLISIIIFTMVFYLVFSKFREQVCTVVCPYGRLQDVLLDKKSLLVIYDKFRGENRGKLRKDEDRNLAQKGDCIDCKQCVNVCPTGIDIRNGTQLECVNCTACIDACNDVMQAVNLPKGLIRFDSEEGIEKQQPFKITTRVWAYIAVLITLLSILTVSLILRKDFEATILRTRGTLFQQVEEGVYSNIYDINVVNKTNKDLPITLKVGHSDATIKLIGKPLHLNPQEELQSKFLILLPEAVLPKQQLELEIALYVDNEWIETVTVSFVTPGI